MHHLMGLIFRDKGKYYNNINLSDKGLKGDGILEYLSSESKSKEIFSRFCKFTYLFV